MGGTWLKRRGEGKRRGSGRQQRILRQDDLIRATIIATRTERLSPSLIITQQREKMEATATAKRRRSRAAAEPDRWSAAPDESDITSHDEVARTEGKATIERRTDTAVGDGLLAGRTAGRRQHVKQGPRKAERTNSNSFAQQQHGYASIDSDFTSTLNGSEVWLEIGRPGIRPVEKKLSRNDGWSGAGCGSGALAVGGG
ncbi:unnamed protein product, partial [Heligmosomoides polygyrus]|uniref:SHSP domain-containing protein n=1 Tax=Heligmosomoides polygyrus TaxID=6339 RepID=A0A183F8Q6_HELPZ